MSTDLELQLQAALKRIERLEAAQACRNLMGKYSYYCYLDDHLVVSSICLGRNTTAR